ncbi:MAG: insulinase family protein [Candidatus Omnitrophica bacterium]|nr:insulinase family protein [Candidatus Omnitrophota bacterium]
MYEKTVLDHGLRVVTHDMRQRESVALGFWVGAGGRYEEDHIKGAAHFLEHMAFKGSAKYSCDAVKMLIEGVGGSVNAFTSEEQTCYYAKFPAVHTDRIFDVLSDIVFYPSLKSKDVKKESTVIVEEIKMYHDLPQYYVYELLDQLMWPNHPLGKSLAGTVETVSAMSSSDLKRFHQEHYHAGNIVIAAAGKVEHAHIQRLAATKFRKTAGGLRADFEAADCSQKQPRIKIFKKPTEQMHLVLGMLGLENEHKDKYALNLLNIILGGNMSSRLFDQVREKRGLAYSIGSSVKYFKDTGILLVRAGVDNAKLVDALDVVLKELTKIHRSGVKLDELKRAKDFYLGQVLLALEDTLDHMLWIGESTLTRDKTRSIEEVVKLVKGVTIEDIHRVAKMVVDHCRYNFAVVGPVTDNQEKQLNQLLGIPA